MDRRVTCITTSGPKDDCTCITHIGKWDDIGRITTQEVVRRIEERIDSFWVRDPADGSRADVRVAQRNGRKYLRTEANDTPRDNLLKLPDCL